MHSNRKPIFPSLNILVINGSYSGRFLREKMDPISSYLGPRFSKIMPKELGRREYYISKMMTRGCGQQRYLARLVNALQDILLNKL
jgi:hypothetical protein